MGVFVQTTIENAGSEQLKNTEKAIYRIMNHFDIETNQLKDRVTYKQSKGREGEDYIYVDGKLALTIIKRYDLSGERYKFVMKYVEHYLKGE